MVFISVMNVYVQLREDGLIKHQFVEHLQPKLEQQMSITGHSQARIIERFL